MAKPPRQIPVRRFPKSRYAIPTYTSPPLGSWTTRRCHWEGETYEHWYTAITREHILMRAEGPVATITAPFKTAPQRDMFGDNLLTGEPRLYCVTVYQYLPTARSARRHVLGTWGFPKLSTAIQWAIHKHETDFHKRMERALGWGRKEPPTGVST